jgi:hypothetical protein
MMKNSTSNADRRFVCLVEDKFNYHLDSDDITVVSGTVHGTVSKGDEVYIIDHTGKTLLADVRQLESVNDSGKEHPDSFTDGPVALVLGVSPSEIDKYCVVTNIRPWISKDVNTALENPYLVGMLYGNDFRDDPLYFGKFVYALAHAHYLTAITLSKPPVDKGNGTSVIEARTQINFHMLSNNSYPGKGTIAVFTDWVELNKWKDAPRDSDGEIQTMILKFPDIVHLAVNPAVNGCVINAFSELNLFVPTSMIDNITSLEGYRMEHGDSPKTDN